MIINHNLGASNAIRQMGINSTNANKSMEKLSSGLRINKAGDDAAGLAISEKMRGQIRGLDQASANSQDAISLIQTGEGALNETHSILQRMRELSVQSSNGTATDDDRTAIQNEVNQLTSEIDRIGNTTQFNTMNLLDGSQGKTVNSSAAKTAIQITDAKALDSLDNGTYTLTVANKAGSAAFLSKTGTNNTLGQGDVALDTTSTGANVGETYTLSWDDGDANNATVTLKDSSGKALGTIAAQDWSTPSATQSVSFTVNAQTYKFTVDTNKTGDGAGSITFKTEMKADYTVTNSGGVASKLTGQLSSDGQVDVGGFRVSVDRNLTNAGPSNLVVSGNDLDFQIGANESQTTKLAISDMRASALGVANLDVNDQTSAQTAITTIDKAIKSVSEERGKLGALQNRLEHTIANLGTSSENLTSAESRIRDVDMAKEMSTFSKNNILSQAAQAMLAQANQQPQQVLQLLR
ncbi:flagellin [Bacillus sp. EB600]|uniref:flagellin N-terminal helical domain-containing protein n=1 Tax=Bacillus sp. EB600 TaxID=2806345 RepID=UPI0021096769|nr:flagellin [Bacillus sp. EB600]MCQ6278697.1 flagellin [Bacillus sp. EB600]